MVQLFCFCGPRIEPLKMIQSESKTNAPPAKCSYKLNSLICGQNNESFIE